MCVCVYNGVCVVSHPSWNKCFPIHCAGICVETWQKMGIFFSLGIVIIVLKRRKEEYFFFWVIVCILNFIAVPLNFHLC